MKNIFIIIVLEVFLLGGCSKDNTTQQSSAQVHGQTFPVPNPTSGIYAMAEFNGNLVVGGLPGYGGIINSGAIAQWNGSSWSTLGNGVNGIVYTMVVYNGNLIVGGLFTTAGGIPTNYIAQWNGSSWDSIPGALKKKYDQYTVPAVNAMTIYNGNLIVGGQFDSVGSLYANGIAQWNGATWSLLPATLSVQMVNVTSLVVYNGSLVAGLNAGAGNIVKLLNGTKWDSIGSLTSNNFAIYNGNLIATGNRTIQQWNGSVWSPMDNGIELPSSTFVCNGKLFAGTYTVQDSDFCHVSQWNGTSWTSIREFAAYASSPCVTCFTTYNGNLIAGGYFLSNSVAEYNGSTWTEF